MKQQQNILTYQSRVDAESTSYLNVNAVLWSQHHLTQLHTICLWVFYKEKCTTSPIYYFFNKTERYCLTKRSLAVILRDCELCVVVVLNLAVRHLCVKRSSCHVGVVQEKFINRCECCHFQDYKSEVSDKKKTKEIFKWLKNRCRPSTCMDVYVCLSWTWQCWICFIKETLNQHSEGRQDLSGKMDNRNILWNRLFVCVHSLCICMCCPHT